MRRFLQFFVTVVVALALMIGIGAASMASASATTSDKSVSASDDFAPRGQVDDSVKSDFEEKCQEDGNVRTCTSGKVSTDADADAKVKRLKMKGRVVGEYLVKGGLTRQEVRQSRCYTSHSGWNTLRDSTGKIFKYWDERPQRICNTGVGPSGWQVVECGNTYWPGKKRPKRYRTVRNPVAVQSFENYKLKGKIKVKTKTEARASSSSTATCVGSSSTGSGYGFAASSARATLRFTFRGKQNMQAEAQRVVREHALEINVQAYAKVSSESSAEATSSAMCTDAPVTYQSPSVNASANACVEPGQANGVITVVVGNPNDIDDTATVTVGNRPPQTVSIAAGTTETLTFTGFAPGAYGYSAKLTTANKSATGSVTVQECEVPEQPVTGDVLCKNPPHLYEGGNGIMVCELSQSNGVKPTLSQFSVEALNDHAYFASPTEFGWREEAQVNPCPSNVLCVRVQVWAVSPGLFKYLAKFASYDQVNGQFMIEEDDF